MHAPATMLNNSALDRAVRKNVMRVVPLLAIAYFFNYIDLCLSQIRSAWLGTANRAMKLVHVGPAQPDQVVAP